MIFKFIDHDVLYKKVELDDVYILQHFKDMFENGNFEEKMSIENCDEPIQTNFFYYENITSSNIQCLSFHGFASQLTEILKKSTARCNLL